MSFKLFDLSNYSFPLQFSIAVFHCSLLSQFSIAVFYSSFLITDFPLSFIIVFLRIYTKINIIIQYDVMKAF